MKTYTTLEMLDALDFNQLAIRVEGEEEQTDDYRLAKRGTGLYFDPSDRILKSDKTNMAVLMVKPKNDDKSLWVIVDQ